MRPIEPEPSAIETTLFLIGDAGEPDPRIEMPAPLDSLARQASVAPERSLILFLGDNIYPDGVRPLDGDQSLAPVQPPDSEPREGVTGAGRAWWADALRRLRVQVEAVPVGVRAIFVPGNHDWASEEVFGLYSVRIQDEMIRSLAAGRDIRLLPSNGCPGPVAVDTGRLRLVLLDTQWWLHEYIVRDERSDCGASDPSSVTAELRTLVAPVRDDQVTVVAGHHPLMTGGSHGGYCGAAGPFRRFGGLNQDIMSSANRTMRDSIASAFAEHPPLVFAAGHEHVLQVLRGGSALPWLLVSGAGAKTSCAVWMRETRYASQDALGFMRLDLLREGGVLLRVYRYEKSGAGGLVYTRWLEAP
jgi:hypothetical protein